MRIAYVSLVAVALAASFSTAAPPEVPTGPIYAKVGAPATVVTVKVPKDGEIGVAPAFAPESCLWFPGETDASGNKSYLVMPYKEGLYRVVFWTKGETSYSTLVIDAQGTAPTPKPVDPKVDPKPVDPPKPADKSPWGNKEGLRVMMVYQGSLPATQHSVVFGRTVRDYLLTHCAKDAEGPVSFMWQPKTDVSSYPQSVQDVYNRAVEKAGVNTWWVVGNGDRWEEGPIPASVDAAMAVLKKYGGP